MECGGPIPMGQRYPFDVFLHRLWPVVVTTNLENYAVVATLSSYLFLFSLRDSAWKEFKAAKASRWEIRIRSNELYHFYYVRVRSSKSRCGRLHFPFANERGAMKVSTTATTVIIDPQGSMTRKGRSRQNDWKVVVTF